MYSLQSKTNTDGFCVVTAVVVGVDFFKDEAKERYNIIDSINAFNVLITRQTASMSNSRPSNNNRKSPPHSLTINHITAFVLKINKKQLY